MLEIRTINAELTMMGYFRKGLWVEISKHTEYTISGTKKTFCRVDGAWGTISTLNDTKAEAIKEARAYIRKNNWKDK